MATLIGISGPVWGTIGDSEIIVDNIRETRDGGWEDLPDGQGRIVAYAVHGDAGQVQMDFIIRDGAAASYLLERGQVITLPTGESNISPSVSIYLATWEKTKTKNGWFAGSLTANYSPSIS